MTRMSEAMIKTEVLDTVQALEPFVDEWNQLCLEAPQQTPFLSHAWIASYLAHLVGPSESWFCIIAREAERLVGVLPLIVTPLRVAGQQQFVLRAPADPHIPTGDALVKPGRENAVLSALISAAARHYPKHLYIDLSRVPDSSGSVSVCTHGIKGCKTMTYPMGRGAYLPIRGSFEEYRASLSSNFRSNLNKSASKLSKLPNVTEQFLTGRAATEAMLPRFMEVEAKSWKGRAGTAILKSNELVEFYTTLCRRLSAAGWLEWHFLNTGDQTIAANLAIRMNSTVHVWKLGYDDDFAKCSPGGMLFERLVKRAYTSGEIAELSLLTDHAWYDRWQMQWRQYYGVRLYPAQARAWAVWAFHIGREWAAKQKLLRRAWTSLRPSSV